MKALLRTLAVSLLACALTASTSAARAGDTPNADEALARMLEGNERFASGRHEGPRRTPADIQAVAEGQKPFATVVACADSRVPPELLFDVGVGDLFVVRVAGNVVDGAGVAVAGSIEYSIAELEVPLVVVLGHSHCGAIKAAVQHVDQKNSLPGAIDGLVELMKPAAADTRAEPGDPYANAMIENVRNGVEALKTLDPILAPQVKEGRVKVVGGVYDLDTGRVALVAPLASDKEAEQPVPTTK